MNPVTMLVMEITAHGPPDVLQPSRRPVPVPTGSEVLIEVAAAGVNRPDVMQRKGLYPPPPGASDIPGLEIAGRVVALGGDVVDLATGDAVCALVTGGGYAEYCRAPAELCLPVPEGLELIEAAALPETFFTVWSNVFQRGHLAAGESILVHGGSGGIGTTAIQLCKAFSARVITTAGSDEKCTFCRQLGADAAINYRTRDFVAVVDHWTEGHGVDLILDMIGGDYFPRNIKCLADDARLLQIGVQQGPKSVIDLLPVMLKRLTITGSTLRARSIDFKAKIAGDLLERVWPLLANRQIKPVIDRTLPLTQAAEAHALMESSGHIGKIILTVAPPDNSHRSTG